jgi:dynein heavy chain
VPVATGDRAAFLAHIDALPPAPAPEAFGLHDNADITKDLAATDAMVAALLQCGGGGGGNSGGGASHAEETVGAIVKDLLKQLPVPFDLENAAARYPVRYDQSMNQVLCQEMQRYNRLTAVVRTSLHNLDRALRGLQVSHVLLSL